MFEVTELAYATAKILKSGSFIYKKRFIFLSSHVLGLFMMMLGCLAGCHDHTDPLPPP